MEHKKHANKSEMCHSARYPNKITKSKKNIKHWLAKPTWEFEGKKKRQNKRRETTTI